MSGSGINWAVCKSAPCSRQTTTPASHHSVFYRPDALPATKPTASKHWKLFNVQKFKNVWINTQLTITALLWNTQDSSKPGNSQLLLLTNLYRMGCCTFSVHHTDAAVQDTRSSAITEGPRDVLCQLKSCQLPRNSAEKSWTKYQLSLIDPCDKIVL